MCHGVPGAAKTVVWPTSTARPITLSLAVRSFCGLPSVYRVYRKRRCRLSWTLGDHQHKNSMVWSYFATKEIQNLLVTDVNIVLLFLTHLDKSGLSHCAINTARGALSAINHDAVGKHPLVYIFLIGIFHRKPSLPRYSVTWDVTCVLKYLRTMSPYSKLSLK